MSQQVTIGGNRVGSGKKMQAELHDYYRSTHNLSEKFASSMASGVLVPAMCKLAMRGDTFDINIGADARTVPTVAPLFGSYKMQVDVYQCPVRLYQGILHNNPLAIGLNMSKVKFPTLEIWTTSRENTQGEGGKFSESSLLTYLGMRGLGRVANQATTQQFGRKINALPALCYYDIFKTYYANKQEENAYIIVPQDTKFEPINWDFIWLTKQNSEPLEEVREANYQNNNALPMSIAVDDTILLRAQISNLPESATIDGTTAQNWIKENIKINTISVENLTNAVLAITKREKNLLQFWLQWTGDEDSDQATRLNAVKTSNKVTSDIKLQPFKLSNIDDMRYDLLGHHELGTAYEIKITSNPAPYLPYSALVSIDGTTGYTYNKFAMNGLCLKTYQNDMFNNWLNSEWIEGENGINELTKVAVVDGAFSMDALNMSMKLYNMLNRIALAGGTYEDWQDVVYEEVQRRQIESPIYIGGMSQEIVFDEIVQTTPTEGSPLGTLGGRGRLNGKQKGGRIHVKCDEACFIIAIVSLTPRIMYTQGNEFYMTDIFSMDDLHKPAMDGIGFQDLIGERLAHFDTVVSPNSTSIIYRSKVGKLPAWIEYMTSYDRAYGDFAGEYGKGFMTLNRNYEADESTGAIKDATTYIDPSKYNYAFAVQELSAQNFWVEIQFEIKARRLMSARLIPNV